MSTAEKLRQEGIAEERKENLRSFVHRAGKQGIPIETIANIVELDESSIEQILNNKNIEIPLHLLDKNRQQRLIRMPYRIKLQCAALNSVLSVSSVVKLKRVGKAHDPTTTEKIKK